MRRTSVLILAVLLVFSFAMGLAACTSDTPAETPATEQSTESGSNDAADDAEAATDESADPTEALIESKCSLCHTTERVWAADYDRTTWAATTDRMKANGLVITDDEYTQIVDYLSGL